MLDTTRALDFLAPLALRLYLAPVFWMARTKKLADFDMCCTRPRRRSTLHQSVY